MPTTSRYGFMDNVTGTRKVTPQTVAVPGRESEMAQMASGGVGFKADMWTRLRRGLILGTAQGSFYATRETMTKDLTELIKESAKTDAVQTANIIAEAGNGLAISQSSVLYAIAVFSTVDTPEVKAEFLRIFNSVVRTNSHLLEWLSYTKPMRGLGTVIHRAVLGWITAKSDKELAYQWLKYNNRNGFKVRDVMRLFRPTPPGKRTRFKPVPGLVYNPGITSEIPSEAYIELKNGKRQKFNPEHVAFESLEPGRFGSLGIMVPDSTRAQVYEYFVDGWPSIGEQPHDDEALRQIWWFEWLKRNPKEGVRAIREGRLTHEMVTSAAVMTPEVWEALLLEMPVTALLRNLATLTRSGVLSPNNGANLKRVADVLTDGETLRTARVHPADILKALKTYQSGGTFGLSQNSRYTPVPAIVEILQLALRLSFGTQEATLPNPYGLVVDAVDTSGSMGYNSLNMGSEKAPLQVKASEVAAVMALVAANSDPNQMFLQFNGTCQPMGINKHDTLASVTRYMQTNGGGSTDASQVFRYLMANGLKADLVRFWTDGESWAGTAHTFQVLNEYRRTVSPDCRVVYGNLVYNHTTLADPNDPLALDIVGFSPDVPKVISGFAKGKF